MEALGGEAKIDDLLKNELGEHYFYYKQMKAIMKMKGVQARLPYVIDIR